MSAEIVDAAGGILTLKITGNLTRPELAAAQRAAADVIRKQGKMRILVVTENFQGWARGGDWGDTSFQVDNDASIERMAIVGERKWEDLAVMFAGKGFRRFPIRYLEAEELPTARAWLAANS